MPKTWHLWIVYWRNGRLNFKNEIQFSAINKAITLRKKLGEDPFSPIDVFSLISNSDDITVVFYPMGENISGLCRKEGREKLIGINSSMSKGRQRFSLAHELCHLYFHDLKEIVCSAHMAQENDDELEKEADEFASYFLLPPGALEDFFSELGKSRGNISLPDIIRLEQLFQLSHQATLVRLSKEGFITRDQVEEFKNNVVRKANELGYDTGLYYPSPQKKQALTLGKYIRLAKELKTIGAITQGRFENLLDEAFRHDIIMTDEEDERIHDD